MKKCSDIFGGFWVMISLLFYCKCKLGSGSYLAWRRETAFGKANDFPNVSNSMKLSAMWSWAVWAWREQRELNRSTMN